MDRTRSSKADPIDPAWNVEEVREAAHRQLRAMLAQPETEGLLQAHIDPHIERARERLEPNGVAVESVRLPASDGDPSEERPPPYRAFRLSHDGRTLRTSGVYMLSFVGARLIMLKNPETTPAAAPHCQSSAPRAALDHACFEGVVRDLVDELFVELWRCEDAAGEPPTGADLLPGAGPDKAPPQPIRVMPSR